MPDEIKRYLNHYRCQDDGTTWDMDSDCMCDDECPICGTEYTPISSEELPVGDAYPVEFDDEQ
jgi:hypothetical protein